MTAEDQKLIQEINTSSIEERLMFLHKIFEKAVYIREDAWFHYQDGLSYEIKDIEMLEILGKLLKEMSENGGKLKDESH